MKTNTIQRQVDEALALSEKGKTNLAEAKVTELYKKHPDHPFVIFAMGVINGMKGLQEEAIKFFNKTLEADPNFPEAWFNLAIIYQNQRNTGKMIKAYQKVVETGNLDVPIVKRAFKFIRDISANVRNEFSISLTEFLKASDSFENALDLMDESKWEDALAGLRESLAINPKSQQAWDKAGVCLGKLGRIHDALEAFDEALKIDPVYEPAIKNKELTGKLKEGEILEEEYRAVDYKKDFMQ